MNFLSHYYFDKDENPYQILGSVLPDLLKNAMNVRIHPEKNPSAYMANKEYLKILIGWNKHLSVDKHFHNSTFFFQNTAKIKVDIKPIVETTLFRPSFLAHITLELILDHLLLVQNKIQVDDFYSSLRRTNVILIEEFLMISGIVDPTPFLNFFASFQSSRYLFSYQQPDNISSALNHICMRIWKDKLNEDQLRALTNVVLKYTEDLSGEYLNIFKEIHP